MNESIKESYTLSANEAIFLIKQKKISVNELINSFLERIEKLNPTFHAWVHVTPEMSINVAKNLDSKHSEGIDISPLYGIPIGIKDVFNTKDFPNEMGSPIWKGFTPGNDSRVISYLRMANAIILGKTETAEFAVHALGKSKNPHDSSISPGTSSSGSAVAVATQMVPIALGTQTGGSIIRPASYCGIYGFKPSFGLIPRTGVLKTTDSLDHIGYFANDPSDLELLFDIIRVKGRDYPISEAALSDDNRQSVINRKWRIKFVKSPVWDCAEDYAQSSIIEFVKKLSKENDFDVDEFILPEDFIAAHKTHSIIYTKSLTYYFKEELKNKSLVSDIFYEFASQEKNITSQEYDKAIEHQVSLRNLLDESFKQFDIIISLSTSGHAPLRDEQETDDPSLIWTMCGIPTINIPAFITPSGLPLGVQISARRFNDKLLLKFLNLLAQKGLAHKGPNPIPKID